MNRVTVKLLGPGLTLLLTSVAQSAGPAPSTPANRPAKDKPNVLFIVVDDLRTQLGCYGHQETHSPNIDRLAASGTLFRRAYCTVPVCGPSRLSVLTGLRTGPDQWTSDTLKRPFISLPAWFAQHGYYTISNGKVFHAMLDRQADWTETPWRSIVPYKGKGDWAAYNIYGLWLNPESARLMAGRSGRGPYCEAADQPDSLYPDGRLADKTIADLQRLKQMNKPFFLAVGFFKPHLPLNAPKKYWDLYDRDRIVIADNRYRPRNAPQGLKASGEIDRYQGTGAHKKTVEFHREARHAYYACVSFIDAQIGRVLQALEELDLADRTVVVLWGDHGWNLGEHDFWGKHNTMHHCLHAPLLIRAPGHRAGNATDALVEFVDIYPTLCELAGLPIPEHCQGISALPLLDQPDLAWKSAAFSQWRNCRAVKTDRYLYTEWANGEKMLFDHTKDPEENVNIAGQPELAAIVQEHHRLLEAGWRAALPDIRTVPADLTPPPVSDLAPAPGRRVRQTLDAYAGTEVYHCLYLPTDWQPGKRYPLIVEYVGNGPYRNRFGDVCTGKVEDSHLGYGISGGKGFIWLCLPYISNDHRHNQLQWWGDVEATVTYCKAAVEKVCDQYGADRSAIFLAGFSRGAIACNYIGLHDDQIAALWRGFICHSHYDGLRQWNYSDSDAASASRRLRRLRGRPQFISHEGSVMQTREYLQRVCPDGQFTFVALPYRNHTDTWVLRDIPARRRLRQWVHQVLSESPPSVVSP